LRLGIDRPIPERPGRNYLLRLADQKMNMFRHDDIPAYNKIETDVHPLQRLLEQAARRGGVGVRKTMVITESDEVETAGLLVTNQALRHANILHPVSQKPDMGHILRVDLSHV